MAGEGGGAEGVGEDDRVPFMPPGDLRGEASSMLVTAVAGQTAGRRVLDSALATQGAMLRQSVLSWGKRWGFAEQASCLARTTEGVLVRVPLADVTSGTAILLARTVRVPLPLRLSIEPQGWLGRLTGRLRRDVVRTGDPELDVGWRVTASDVPAATQLLDARCRAAVRALSTWCLVTYDHGELEARVDAEAIAGVHLLEAEALLVALALADVRSSPYR